MGFLHGGAVQKAMEVFKEIKEKNISLRKWVRQKLQKKEKIAGFGHRVYKSLDPRAKELKELSQKLDQIKGNDWSSIATKLSVIVKEEKSLYPNVDLYTASVYANLGIPDDFFVNLFAISRMAGWLAHMMEQYEKNELIRPLQEYVGLKDRDYISIEKR